MYTYPTQDSTAEIKYRQAKIRESFQAGVSRGMTARGHHTRRRARHEV